MGIFSKFLSPGGDSGQAANQYLNQIPGVGQKYLQPYVDEGRNPTAFIDQIMQSYKPSSGYQFKEDRLRRNAGNEAAAGGFRGTPTDTENQSQLINALLGEDMQQYINNVLGIHKQGYQASSDLTDLLGSNLATQGELGFRGAESKNANRIALLKQLLETGGNLAGAAMGAPGSGSALSSLFGGAGGGRGGGGGGDLFQNNGNTTFRSPLNQRRMPQSPNQPGYGLSGYGGRM